jgi:hypothetical protein
MVPQDGFVALDEVEAGCTSGAAKTWPPYQFESAGANKGRPLQAAQAVQFALLRT